MNLGGFVIRAVEAGRFRLDGGAMFGVVPKVLWQKTNPADGNNRIEMSMRMMYVEGGGRRLLVDSGAGTKNDEKMVRNYEIDTQPLGEVLLKNGIDPLDVTDVVVSHLHFDHAGGYTFYDEGGEMRLTFPNAVHHIQKRQWDAAVNPNEKDRASFFNENFLPINELGKLDLLDGDAELYPGVSVIKVEGHSAGQQLALVDTGEGAVLFCADLIPLASHVNLPYIMAYDHFPLTTLEEKKRILGMAAERGWILFFEHDPVVPACRVTRNEKGRFEISEIIEIG